MSVEQQGTCSTLVYKTMTPKENSNTRREEHFALSSEDTKNTNLKLMMQLLKALSKDYAYFLIRTE